MMASNCLRVYSKNFRAFLSIKYRGPIINPSCRSCSYGDSAFKETTSAIQQAYSRRFNEKPITIGCASGFWGDTPCAVPQLIHRGNLNFLVFDYLSEVTMSLLVAARMKNPDLGYTPDFVHHALTPHFRDIKSQGLRIVSNAGGINPHGCADALRESAKKQGYDFKIAVVTGDNLFPETDSITQMGVKDMKSGEPLPENVHSMNAYLGAGAICEALNMGADIVITGRCVDSALTLGPLLHSFKWSSNDFNKLAAGSVAGHLLECGAQATGGIFTDWHNVDGWDDIGFPIAKVYSDGSFEITKPEGTGGCVSTATVSEQLLYEIDDPENYILPDVVCDLRRVTLESPRDNVVSVDGVKGKPPPDTYKVSATYADGFRCTVMTPVRGPRAAQKARKTAEALLKRCRRLFAQQGLEDFRRYNIEILGSEQAYGKHAKPGQQNTRDIAMWIAVHHNEKRALDIFSREIASAATGAAPGLTTLVGGRPKPFPLIRLFSFLLPKEQVKIEISMDGVTKEYVPQAIEPSFEPQNGVSDGDLRSSASLDKKGPKSTIRGNNTYRLEELAYTRSGDKGDTANIGVIARHPNFYPYLQRMLTEEAVTDYFEHLLDYSIQSQGKVKRYFLPGINAMNFVMNNALGGGGVASLRSDPQGKALGQMLLDFELKNMPKLEDIMSH